MQGAWQPGEQVQPVETSPANPLNLRSFGHPPSQITKFLWLGNAYDVVDERFIVDHIKEVILVGGWHPPRLFPGVAYVHYPLPQPFGVMCPRAEAVVQRLIQNQKRRLPTFLVCHEGIDRGPTIALKFLKDAGFGARKMSWKQAEDHIRMSRSIAVPHREWWG